MPSANNGDEGAASGMSEYEAVLLLEELDSLLEDVEEQGEGHLQPSLQAELREYGFSDATELRAKIRELHIRLDLDDNS